MKYIPYVIIVVLIICMFFQYGKTGKEPEIIMKRDTVIVHDTVFFEKPVVKTIVKVEKDTVYIPTEDKNIILDRETKIYEDSTFRAQISGIKANLDWVETYPVTKYITTEKVVQIKEKQPLIQFKPVVGIGYGVFNKAPDVFVGAGLTINIKWNK